MSFLQRLRAGLSRTREAVARQVQQLVGRGRSLDEDILERIEEILIAADVGVDMSMRLVEAVRERARVERKVDGAVVLKWLEEEALAVLTGESDTGAEPEFRLPDSGPYVAMVVGVNGTGKTTTVAKLAKRLLDRGHSVVLAAADTFRAAAGEQLEIWAHRIGTDIVRQQPGADPAAVAFDAIKAAIARGRNAVLVDTAGRLHTKTNLMAELAKIHRVCGRALEGAPHEVLLVIDATTGQNGLAQAKQFAAAVDVTGVVLTKLDGTAKGGIVLAIRDQLGIPVKWVGLGEGMDDLEPFDPSVFVKAFFEGYNEGASAENPH